MQLRVDLVDVLPADAGMILRPHSERTDVRVLLNSCGAGIDQFCSAADNAGMILGELCLTVRVAMRVIPADAGMVPNS